MKLNKHLILLITLIIGLSLIIGTVSATDTKKIAYKTINKQTSVYSWQITGSYYKNQYIKISKGKTYVNGYVYAKNPFTGKFQKAPVYGHNVVISPLNKNVKIKMISIRSIGWPSGKFYYNKYTTKTNKWISPGKYKGFDKFTIYYTVNI